MERGNGRTHGSSYLPVIGLDKYLFRDPYDYAGVFSGGHYTVFNSSDYRTLSDETPMK